MVRRFLLPALLLGVSIPAAAQEMAPTPADQQLRYQMQTFEAVLEKAVSHGADAFARQQKELPDGVDLTSDAPEARGFAPPEGGGMLFLVVVPQIRASVNLFLTPQLRRGGPQPIAPAARNGLAQPVNGAQGVLTADPMTASPVIDDGRCATRAKPSRGYATANYEYAVAVCDALMDAMLDNGGPLPLKSEEWLTVAAVDGTPTSPAVVNSPFGYTTYLQIKGSDLLLLRQGKLTKDEARKLVVLKQR